MDSIINKISFGDILRQMISGCLFFVSYFYTSTGSEGVKLAWIEQHYASLIIMSALIGVITYNLYRSLLDPFVDLLLLNLITDKVVLRLGKCSLYRYHIQRWTLETTKQEALQRFSSWADANYLFLTSAICIIYATAFSLHCEPIILRSAGLLVLAGLINSANLRISSQLVINHYDNISNKPRNMEIKS